MPFYGGEPGEGDTVATLISNEGVLLNSFSVIPRTAAVDALISEHNFQMSGLTDSDSIAGIGHILNASYVLSGSLRRLGNRNLLIATVVDVQSFKQVAGYYLTYVTLGEIRGGLPAIAQQLADATIRSRSEPEGDSLAIVPFSYLAGVDRQDAETLTQILAIEFLRTGSYAILPRTATIQSAIAEQGFQRQGVTSDEGLVSLGRAINADYVLGGTVSRLAGVSVFAAQVLRVSDGSLSVGTSRNYGVISDGLFLMEEIAILLTDPENAEERIAVLNRSPGRAERVRFLEQERRREANALRQAEADERRRQRDEARAERADARRERMEPVAGVFGEEGMKSRSVRNDLEWPSVFFASVTGGFRAVGSSIVPVLIPSGVYWSPVPYTSLGFEARSTKIDGEESPLNTAAVGLGIVISPWDRIKFSSNILLEMGSLAGIGIITDKVTLGFDIGFSFDPRIVGPNLAFLNLKYRNLKIRDGYVNAFGLGVSLTFEALRDIFGALF
ncbi:MAG: hypothetical protein FWD94_02895 [Treponema sp.]|nr:hypothetical protein [Treponema sp.]